MKSIYKIFLLALGVYTYAFSQITDITRFPFQDKEKEYRESIPVVISEDEILIIYYSGSPNTSDYWGRTIDTLYYSKSTNGGTSWNEPVCILELGANSYSGRDWDLTSIRTSSGRIIIAWYQYALPSSIKLIHSDDNGKTWSDTTSITSASQSFNCNLSEIDSGRIFLSYTNYNGTSVKYRESTDNGETWSQIPATFIFSSNKIRNLLFVSVPFKILAFFEFTASGVTQNSGIYYKVSTDNGFSWSANKLVIDSPTNEKNPRVIKFSDSNLEIIYQVEDTTQKYDRQNDIYSIQSSNGGVNWALPERFTKYAGEDRFVQTARLVDNVFITFSSTRFTNKDQISYVLFGETIETFRPPYIKTVFATQDSIDTKKWLVSSKITDDEQVVLVNVEFEDGSSTELYDDGKHSDGDSADYIFANTISFKYYSTSTTGIINVNKVQLPFNNSGVLADVIASLRNNSVFRAIDNSGFSSDLATSLEVTNSSGARYDEGVFLFSGGFGLSGYTNGELWANAQATASRIINYIPGRVGDNPENSINVIYEINSSDPPFGYSWQRWKDAVSLGADFYDGDGDGIYNPVDKNWNGILDPNEDMPDLLGDVTAWCVYNDGVPASMRERFVGIAPQGIEVEQTLFASSKPELENIIFLRYKLTNKGTVANVLDSVIFSFWADPDLGDHLDDLVGCDTLLSSIFSYNDGADNEYGLNTPALFTTLLQGPIIESQNLSEIAYDRRGIIIGFNEYYGCRNQEIISSVHFDAGFLFTYPNTEYEMRYFMKGLNSVGDKLDPCNYFRSEVRGGVECSKVNPLFWYSGDPVGDIGWINVVPSDQRTMLSVGEFTLEKNKPVTIIGAYVLGRGTDPLNSITVARENVQRSIQEYLSNFASLTYNPGEPTNPVVNYILYQNYPNPFNPTTTIRYELPQDGVVTIEVFDILGQKVKTILNEFKKADRYEVTFTSTGLASGVYIYQLRVNDFITSKKMVILR